MLTIFRMPLISFYSLLAALVFHFCLSLSLSFSLLHSLCLCVVLHVQSWACCLSSEYQLNCPRMNLCILQQ